MAEFAVVKTGGKQYVVHVGSVIVVDKIEQAVGEKVSLDTLAKFTSEGTVDLGMPMLTTPVSAEIVQSGKGEKIRVAKFKAKVRYRRVRGFRASLTQLKITSL